jgi:hypothetical protein
LQRNEKEEEMFCENFLNKLHGPIPILCFFLCEKEKKVKAKELIYQDAFYAECEQQQLKKWEKNGERRKTIFK